MKKLFFFLTFIVTTFVASAQIANPVTWTYTSKKLSDNVYEVYLTATIEKGWHLYSQIQPKNAVAQPTSFSFNKNPLLELDGKVKETGKMEKFEDKELDVAANQYSKVVVFTQKVKLKGKAKTSITGKVSFQTCDDKKCLPPKTINFTVSI